MHQRTSFPQLESHQHHQNVSTIKWFHQENSPAKKIVNWSQMHSATVGNLISRRLNTAQLITYKIVYVDLSESILVDLQLEEFCYERLALPLQRLNNSSS